MSKLVEIKTNTNESIKVASIKADIISKIIEIASMCDKGKVIYKRRENYYGINKK